MALAEAGAAAEAEAATEWEAEALSLRLGAHRLDERLLDGVLRSPASARRPSSCRPRLLAAWAVARKPVGWLSGGAGVAC